MKLGAASWPFRWDPPYEGPLRRIAALDLKAAEIVVWDDRNFDDLVDVQPLRDFVASQGLEISQLVYTPRGMAHPDPQRRQDAVTSFSRAVDVAQRLGVPLVNAITAYPFDRIVPRVHDRWRLQTFKADMPRDGDWNQNFLDYVECIRACADVAEDAGVRLTLEAHPFRWASNTASLLRLIDAVDSDALGVNLDPAHFFAIGDLPRSSIGQLGDRIFNCHVGDNDGTSNMQFRPGVGKIDWEEVLTSLEDVGYDGVLSLELMDAPGIARWGHSTAGQLPPGVFRGKQPIGDPDPTDATDEFIREVELGRDFLRDTARRVGITLD